LKQKDVTFKAFCHVRHCLYYGAHDPEAYYKVLNFFGDQYTGYSADHVPISSLYITNWPGDSCVPDQDGNIEPNYQMTYNIVVGVYNGDWWDGTQIYRE
jgi:hypothetical protein